jgi:hypothetical protein
MILSEVSAPTQHSVMYPETQSEANAPSEEISVTPPFHEFTTNEIKSHKARLNLHGGKPIYGMNYFETYAPVVTWFAIRLMIIFGIIFCWALRQVDFVMAYPQAPIEMDIYMEYHKASRPHTGTPRITC